MKKTLVVCILAGCAARPAPPLQDPLAPEPAPSDVTHRALSYGDTRTGVFIFENQMNVGEGVHDWLAAEMVKRLAGEKAPVFFTGDAVYAGGATFHYDNFIRAVSRFKSEGLLFYPGVGNHELISGIFGVLSPWFDSCEDPHAVTKEGQQLAKFVQDRHLEMGQVGHDRERLPKKTVGRLDARAAELDHQVIPTLEDQEKSKSAEDRIQNGQHVMEALYVKRAGFDHLAHFFSVEKRTFYSVEIAGAGETKPSILAIMLDTNSLDYLPQKQWFLSKLRDSKHDLVIVFGHHPPGTVEGWDDEYMAAFHGHKMQRILSDVAPQRDA